MPYFLTGETLNIGSGDVKAGGGAARAPGGGDEHDTMVARLRHEKAARVALLHRLDALRARKVEPSRTLLATKTSFLLFKSQYSQFSLP